jgi:electron transfer flavoprotein beta subunit
MHTVVCLKQIIDPETPPDLFRLDPATNRQIRGGRSLVISAYAQNALERVQAMDIAKVLVRAL